ncbi:hypothetical protein N7448_007097 [Penicillium atrosanguineum]|uniref:Uncharacterized protein n=1 Tax=Penicillium atrosanguineum TaxID=1132637 RepID=A0A9W9PSY1_9EURO|nr:hypothetical protein N7448_007097 [Penicillium atrosanguineum]KAJ5141171.1 hypothetical protein N7526_002166 [Penicillium atrosanguineum]KAJ5308428.1 hypothetical protein N7476_009084 [Penicillium atrosanguineum]
MSRMQRILHRLLPNPTSDTTQNVYKVERPAVPPSDIRLRRDPTQPIAYSNHPVSPAPTTRVLRRGSNPTNRDDAETSVAALVVFLGLDETLC